MTHAKINKTLLSTTTKQCLGGVHIRMAHTDAIRQETFVINNKNNAFGWCVYSNDTRNRHPIELFRLNHRRLAPEQNTFSPLKTIIFTNTITTTITTNVSKSATKVTTATKEDEVEHTHVSNPHQNLYVARLTSSSYFPTPDQAQADKGETRPAASIQHKTRSRIILPNDHKNNSHLSIIKKKTRE